jgi:hypothetical protein
MFVELKLARGSSAPGTLFINLDHVATVHVSEDGTTVAVTLVGSDKHWTLEGENVSKMLLALRQNLQRTEGATVGRLNEG